VEEGIFCLKGGNNMKYASIHPVEYLSVHLVYEKIRITVLSLLTSPKILPIILIAIVPVGLYDILAQLHKVGTVSAEEVSTPQFYGQSPELVLDPLVGYPVFSITF
jgi:hypothetical protein